MRQAANYPPLQLWHRFAGALMIGLLFAVAANALAASPVPPDEASVTSGAQLFSQYCTECHGRDGRAQVDVISDATDLTEPDQAYYSGASEDEIFNSIIDGAGVAMPPWRGQITNEADIWHLVNFIRSLWTQEQRDAF